MIIESTGLEGLALVRPDPFTDERGEFARLFCEDEFRAGGLPTRFVQHNRSTNRLKGTVRGLHFQRAPHAEGKLVRCTRGAVFDVAVDLRPGSATFGQWFGQRLDADSGLALFLPEGFAHGYQTLEDGAEVYYMVTAGYSAAASDGIRFDDPAIGIDWPLEVTAISERDQRLPVLRR